MSNLPLKGINGSPHETQTLIGILTSIRSIFRQSSCFDGFVPALISANDTCLLDASESPEGVPSLLGNVNVPSLATLPESEVCFWLVERSFSGNSGRFSSPVSLL